MTDPAFHIPQLLRAPNCWEFFGFNGPTNQHNLDLARQERMNATLGWLDYSEHTRIVEANYKQCLSAMPNPNRSTEPT
jgi:hypothetical protein